MRQPYRAKSYYQSLGIAKSYDQQRFFGLLGRLVNKLEKSCVQRLLCARVDVGVGGTFIDVACGTGRITEILVNSAEYLVGADISPSMLIFARNRLRKYENVGLVRCDAEQLPFRERIARCSTAIRLMPHIPLNIRIRVLQELRRVTTDFVIISYTNPVSLSGILRTLSSIVRRKESCTYDMTPRRTNTEMEASGFRVSRVRAMLGPVSVTYFILGECPSEETSYSKAQSE